MMFLTEATVNGGEPPAWLEAIRKATGEFWDVFLEPLADELQVYAENELGISLPSSFEEWYVIGAIARSDLAITLLDLGTDLIPILGEAKGLAKTMTEALNGNYGASAFEFVAVLAGVVPIGDLIKGGNKFFKVVKNVLEKYKYLRVLKNTYDDIFPLIVSYIDQGWKIASSLGDSVMKFADEFGNIVGEISDKGVPNIIKKVFAGIIDPSTFKKLVGKDLPNANGSNWISRAWINTNSNKFNVIEPNMRATFDDIVANGDKVRPPGWGKKTEALLKDVLEDSGDFVHVDGSYTQVVNGAVVDGVNGFDGVFINGSLDNFEEIIINESKQYTGSGISLSGPGSGPNGISAQLTDDWIRDVCQKLRDKGKPEIGDAVELALDTGKLTKVVTTVDRTGGQLTGGINVMKIK
jgi:hypothetical protein